MQAFRHLKVCAFVYVCVCVKDHILFIEKGIQIPTFCLLPKKFKSTRKHFAFPLLLRGVSWQQLSPTRTLGSCQGVRTVMNKRPNSCLSFLLQGSETSSLLHHFSTGETTTGVGLPQLFPEGSPRPPSTSIRGSLVHRANTVYASRLLHHGNCGWQGVTKRSVGERSRPHSCSWGPRLPSIAGLVHVAGAAALGAAGARSVHTAPARGGAGAGREEGWGVLVT